MSAKKIWISSREKGDWLKPPLHLDHDGLLIWLKQMPEGAVSLSEFINGFIVSFRDMEDFLAFKLIFGEVKNYAELVDMPIGEEIRIIIK